MNHADLICLLCMREKHAPEQIPCPHCGGDDRTLPVQPPALPPRTVLDNRYVLGRTLGQGGFGITYKAYDLRMNNTVAVKEYFPSSIVGRDSTVTNMVTVNAVKGGRAQAEYASGLRHFLNEARRQARMASSPGVVAVNDFFEANNTAYYVMEFVDGCDLVKYVKESQPLSTVIELLEPIAQSLEQIHSSGMIHRDISPDNIMCSKNGSRKLLDFGASHSFTEDESTTGNATLKHGFAPPEQYGSSNMQGPWTDVYAFAATIYWCITGKVPQDSMDRSIGGDQLKKPIELGAILTPEAEKVILRGMTLPVTARYQDVRTFWGALKKANAKRPVAENVPGNPTEEPEITMVSNIVTKTEKPAYYFEEPEVTTQAQDTVFAPISVPGVPVSESGGVEAEEPEVTVFRPVSQRAVPVDMPTTQPPVTQPPMTAVPEQPVVTVTETAPAQRMTQRIMLAVIIVLALVLALVLWGNFRGNEPGEIGDSSTIVEQDGSVMVAGHEIPMDATELYITGDSAYTNQRFSNMSFLNADTLGEQDMLAIGQLSGLKKLYLVNLELDNLSELASLKNLTQLCLYGNAVSDLSPLSKLEELTWLDLGRNQIQGVNELSGLTKLVRLYLQENRISDLSGLETLTALQTLNLCGNRLERTAALKSMSGLTMLQVNGCGLSQSALGELAEALSECAMDVDILTDIPENVRIGDISYSTSSQSLFLEDRHLTDAELSNLKYMVNLKVLDLSGNHITNLNLLNSLTGLTELHLDRTGISDISTLSSLYHLQKLSLSGTLVSDLTPLQNLTELTTLDLSNTKVEALDAISGLTGVTWLDISRSNVSDLAPIADFDSLRMLVMGRCDVEDLTQLYELASLKEVQLSRSSYDSEQLKDIASRLPGCLVTKID